MPRHRRRSRTSIQSKRDDMNKTIHLTRRQIVTALAPMAISAANASNISHVDAQLIELGRQFDHVAAQIDDAISDPTKDVTDDALGLLGRLEAEILARQSRTVEGMRVKARAACWAVLGDIDPSCETTLAVRMGLSIVCDLIRLYDPSLENPGALKKLAE